MNAGQFVSGNDSVTLCDNIFALTVLGTSILNGTVLINESSPWDNNVYFETYGRGGFIDFSYTKGAYFADNGYAGRFYDSMNAFTICDESFAGQFTGSGFAVTLCGTDYALIVY